MYLNFNIVKGIGKGYNYEPTHEMYLNLLLMIERWEGLIYEPTHEMYLNKYTGII